MNYNETSAITGELPQNVRVFKNEGQLVIHSDVSSKNSLQITIGISSKVIIGKGCQFFGNCILFIKDNCVCEIGENCRIIDSKIVCDANATVSVGDRTTINGNTSFYCRENYEIRIGKDCMFSQDIVLHAGDAHPIYDTREQKCINNYPKGSPATRIILNDHVWIGWGAMILQNTEIGSGSIVGARSLVKGKFPNNCVLAGSPAKVKRKDTGWKRFENCSTPDEYMMCTNE